MFGIFEKKKRTNIIEERIKELNDKLWLIRMTGEKPDIELKIRYPKGDDVGKSEDYIIVTLNTSFGQRKIAVGKNLLYYGCSNLIKDNSLNDKSLWIFDFNYLFKIKVVNEDVIADISPDVEMSKEDVDLAILEFEEKINFIYEEIVKREKFHDDLINYLKKGC